MYVHIYYIIYIGIQNLIPMQITDNDQFLWAGSSLIAITKDGYLNLHNDVSSVCINNTLISYMYYMIY
jgi:hypothetical protein